MNSISFFNQITAQYKSQSPQKKQKSTYFVNLNISDSVCFTGKIPAKKSIGDLVKSVRKFLPEPMSEIKEKAVLNLENDKLRLLDMFKDNSLVQQKINDFYLDWETNIGKLSSAKNYDNLHKINDYKEYSSKILTVLDNDEIIKQLKKFLYKCNDNEFSSPRHFFVNFEFDVGWNNIKRKNQ